LSERLLLQLSDARGALRLVDAVGRGVLRRDSAAHAECIRGGLRCRRHRLLRLRCFGLRFGLGAESQRLAERLLRSDRGGAAVCDGVRCGGDLAHQRAILALDLRAVVRHSRELRLELRNLVEVCLAHLSQVLLHRLLPRKELLTNCPGELERFVLVFQFVREVFDPLAQLLVLRLQLRARLFTNASSERGRERLPALRNDHGGLPPPPNAAPPSTAR
jgi:hypothetical protein